MRKGKVFQSTFFRWIIGFRTFLPTLI